MTSTTPINSRSAVPRWRRRAYACVGGGCGLLGAACCIGKAIAVGAGIGGLSFLDVWMNRYQPYVIAATVVLVGLWLMRTVRAMAGARDDAPLWKRLKHAGRPAALHAVVCLGAYVVALGLAMTAAPLVHAM